MKFKVELRRVTYDYVTVTVEEDDVTTKDEATDFINNQLGGDWDPQDKGTDEWADVDGTWDVWEVEDFKEPEVPGSKTETLKRAAEATGIPVVDVKLDSSDLTAEDFTGLPVVTRKEAPFPTFGDRLILPKGVSPEEFYARMRELG